MVSRNYFQSGLFFGALAATFLLMAACRSEVASGPAISVTSIQKTFTQGPARLDYLVSNSTIKVADRIRLELTVYAPEDYALKFPEFENKLGKFQIVDQYEDLPEMATAGQLRHRKTMVLEPFLAGDYTVPALEVVFWEKTHPEKTWKLKTEEVAVKVTSLLGDKKDAADISDIAPPMSLPDKRIYWYMAAGAIILSLLAGFIFWRRRRRKQETVRPAAPAHEIALAALERLLAGNLLARGEVKRFYGEVSDILRRYIENRFKLRAPERTTEEFLTELGTNKVLQRPHQQLLHDFLTHCDQVKFAGYQPLDEEIRKTTGLCRRFIKETKPVEDTGGEAG